MSTRHRHPAAMRSLLLVGLTPHEFRLFQHHKIPYSGSTGPCEDPELYPATGPYIATFIEQLIPSLEALRWKRIELEMRDGQLWCRKRCDSSVGGAS